MKVRDIHPEFRGRGYTTRQMINSPKDAIYVWVNSRLNYPKDLAKKLNRFDLDIRSPMVLEQGGIWLRGHNKPLVIDHACDPNHDEYQTIIDYQDWWRFRNGSQEKA